MVGRVEEISKITAIFNKYNGTFDDLINSSDIESPDWPEFPDLLDSLDWPKPINKKTRNAPRSRGSSLNLLEENCKDISFTSLELVPKI